MGKISMGRAIGDAYDLTFGRYPTVLGVVWLPVLLLIAGEYYVFAPLFRAMPDLFRFAAQHPRDATLPPEWERMNHISMAFNLATLVTTAWLRVGVTKLALGLPRGPSFAYFFVGLDELRVIAGYVVFLALYLGAMIGITISVVAIVVVVTAVNAGGIFAAIDPGILTAAAVGFAIVSAIAVLCALIYFQTRLLFLLVPVTVSEKRFGLWRSWELSEGNFWRIAVVAIGTISPLLILEFFLFIAIYVPIIAIIVSTAQHHPEIAHNPPMAVAVFTTLFMKVFLGFVPIVAVLSLVLAPFFCGLSYAPSAYAYRSISEKKGAA